MRFFFDPALAPQVEFAISAATPVRCWTSTDPASPTVVNCPQAPQDTGGGRYFFGGLPSQAGGQTLEIQVPVRVRVPLNGLASGNAARFGVDVTSTFGVASAEAVQHLVVPAAAGGSAATDATAARATRLRVRAGAPARRLRFVLSESARASVLLQRRTRPGARLRAFRTLAARRLTPGPSSIALGRLPGGGSRAVLRLRDEAGNRSTFRLAFRVP